MKTTTGEGGERAEPELPAHLPDMSDFNPNRQPKGIPVGGQFAASIRDEASVSLMDRPTDDRDWGKVSVTEGSRTPWGTADHVDHVADGIAVAGTPGHGGIKLSPERNAEIPAALRNKSGWYEEDCESNIVGMYHPEAFPHYKGGDQEAIREACESSVKNWFPDQYTKATGHEVKVEESSVLRDRAKQADIAAFRAEHASEFVTLGNGDNHADWIPDGYAACKARMDATGEERTFLMPRNEVIHDGMYGRHALVDPNRHLDVTDVVNARPDTPWVYDTTSDRPVQRGSDLRIEYASLSTLNQSVRAEEELSKVYRFRDDDGTEHIESVADHLRRVGVVGKHPHVDGDKVTYSVEMPNSRAMKVSKAAYDAMTSVPDTSDETQKAYIAKERARVKYERARAKAVNTFDPSDRQKMQQAETDYQAAVETHKALREIKDANARAWQAERDQMQKDAFARLAAEKGIAFE